MLDRAGFWMSTTLPMFAELAAARGFGKLLLDMEHGVFDQAEVNSFIPMCRALGFEVYAKVVGPDSIWIQQALDFGVDGVVVPHVDGVEHARTVCSFAKYPPLGARSYAAGRIVGYGGADSGFFRSENARIKCFAMIESARGFDEVEEIAKLAMVDGLFPGPTDLALSRGRPAYVFDEADRSDLARIAKAATDAGKPWVMPAWSVAEREFSIEHGVAWMVTHSEQGIAFAGFAAVASELI